MLNEEKNLKNFKELAFAKCFRLLDVHFGLNKETQIQNISLNVISEDYRSRPDLIIKQLLQFLSVMVNH